ncbi:YncE family protein, partial [Streptomyces sp. NPDC059982]|uniref:YncE family protein n=1 Tax=unclassified Streptomyces TaxID=2593676 RepID=UPI0036B17E48
IAVGGDGTLAVVCERGAGTVAALDLEPLARGRPGLVSTVHRTRLGADVQPRAVALAGGFALIAAARADVMPVLALADGRIETAVVLPAPTVWPAGIAVTADDGYALVTLERAGTLAVVDLLEWTLTRQIPLGAGPRGILIDPADHAVYCALAQAGCLAVVHLDGVDLSNTDGQPQHETLPTGPRPSALTLAHIPDR